jgi:hypothetical protein
MVAGYRHVAPNGAILAPEKIPVPKTFKFLQRNPISLGGRRALLYLLKFKRQGNAQKFLEL